MSQIVRCLIVDDEPVARDILSEHLSRIASIEIVAKCKSALEAFNIINEQNIELIFLDINMPEISGLSFAKSINRNIKIIFTTAYREYAVDGFDLQAVDYLLKPISFDRLLQSVKKYLDENQSVRSNNVIDESQEKANHFFVRSERKMIKISYDDILYIESISDYIKINLKGKSVITRETLTNIEAKLPKSEFLRTHRSFLVATKAIESFTSEFVEINERQIPVSRSYKDETLKRLGNY